MNVNIRRMTLEDIVQVVAIDRVSFSLPWPERSYRFEVTDNPASRAWVAEADGNIIGMIVAWLLADEAHIATIATLPGFRRRGIARALLTHALQTMISEGAKNAVLEVRAGNLAAQEMYRRFGFEESGRRPHYYKDNGEDAILMSLSDLQVNRETSN